ncbi:hypothetical protein L6164_014877 [Bauhinia variegata]|uniref:Uncharacterized protein n=1 Tax=Bauhinia variegata TaxID=167791 RepID=A0ACB9NKE7_BAUVA|nr:hypothetical protein L6164_014877 [Bauhinia variegata]
MEKPSSSSTAKSRAKGKDADMNYSRIALISEDVLHNILAKLPAPSFASAACVNKSWNRICNRILSRPKLSSALSLNPSLPDAVKEVLDKVLCEPIRPHFAIANVGSGFDLTKTLELISERLGSNIAVIVSEANGIIGRDALTSEHNEVKWGALFSGFSSETYEKNINNGILLTIGYLPGLKVDAIPLLRPRKTPQAPVINKFLRNIKEYSTSVSGSAFPVGIILFGEVSTNMKPVLETLDYAMPMDTIIVGDEGSCFVYRSRNNSRDTCGRTGFLEAVALVFAEDSKSDSGKIRFHIAQSNGVLPIGAVYKAASVRTSSTDSTTWLNARREGQQQILDGQSILNVINNELENHIEPPDLYIGVTKRRKFSIGSEWPRPRTWLTFHAVVGGDDEYLYVDGVGIKTGDTFQFYHSDPNTALASCVHASDKLKSIRPEKNSKDCEVDAENDVNVFGGLIFTCYGRGESFFGRFNVDSSPFLENFPGVPFAGIFCSGEIGRPSSNALTDQCQGQSSVSCCLHAYSSVYLVMSYTRPSVI